MFKHQICFLFNFWFFFNFLRYERVDEIIWVKTNQLQRIIRTGRTGHWLNHGKEHCLVCLCAFALGVLYFHVFIIGTHFFLCLLLGRGEGKPSRIQQRPGLWCDCCRGNFIKYNIMLVLHIFTEINLLLYSTYFVFLGALYQSQTGWDLWNDWAFVSWHKEDWTVWEAS